MIKLKPLIENITTPTAKDVVQKLKSILTSTQGRVVEDSGHKFGDEHYPLKIILPTNKLDKAVNDIETALNNSGWYIRGLSWPGIDAAETLRKTSDSDLKKNTRSTPKE